MKSYVCYYGPEPKLSDEETQEQKEKRLARPITVQFTKDPIGRFRPKSWPNRSDSSFKDRAYLPGNIFANLQ
jgi:hypothetical protein